MIRTILAKIISKPIGFAFIWYSYIALNFFHTDDMEIIYKGQIWRKLIMVEGSVD